MLRKKDHKVYLAMCADADMPDLSVNKYSVDIEIRFQLERSLISIPCVNKNEKVD